MNKAFTAIELLVAVFIVSITVAASISLYVFSLENFNIGSTQLNVYINSRNAIMQLARDIRCAAQVVSSYSSYTTGDSCIVLMVPSIDGSGNVQTSYYDYIIYRLQGTDLYQIILKDSHSTGRTNCNRVIAHYCSGLTFSSGGVSLSQVANLSAINTVGICLPLTKTTFSLSGQAQVSQSITPTTVIRLRNK